ncbi:type I-U CRISPR-associated protein Cas8c [Nitratireductor sp. XY-223]|uniref:type I-G CRISPR-associated protein Cas8g2 n=1 Tax=Nitratireductor sp. XY-223 TaxID=2561926 RepID=UPI00145BB5E4|nr:type I-U CRISPR-associated protein Cas8c [Nitratireductor sp. XY-223]
MAEASIPVDLTNPGQVFACLGFLEAADILLGNAEGGFEWSDEKDVRFVMRANGEENPFAIVLEFLAEAKVVAISPEGIEGPWPDGTRSELMFPAPAKSGGQLYTLPIRVANDNYCVPISHWLEGDSRVTFKLFAGQQVGATLARNMLAGDNKKRESMGVRSIYSASKESIHYDPFTVVYPVGGRFGFDARGAWDALRIGTSLDIHDVLLQLSPFVEILAAIGLENARPIKHSTQVKYSAWRIVMPLSLCRAALGTAHLFLSHKYCRHFTTHLGEDKKYKKFFFAQQEATP